MNTEQKIKGALQAFRAAIDEKDGAAMAASLEALDRLAREGKGEMDPRLSHFLERRSYEKAWEWLKEEEAKAERGRSGEGADG